MLCNVNKVAAFVTFLGEVGDLPMMGTADLTLSVTPAATPLIWAHILRVYEDRKGRLGYVWLGSAALLGSIVLSAI
jgi:hypothetical protein